MPIAFYTPPVPASHPNESTDERHRIRVPVELVGRPQTLAPWYTPPNSRASNTGPPRESKNKYKQHTYRVYERKGVQSSVSICIRSYPVYEQGPPECKFLSTWNCIPGIEDRSCQRQINLLPSTKSPFRLHKQTSTGWHWFGCFYEAVTVS